MNKDIRPRICLVEDDEIMGESLCDRFALEGFQIEWRQTGNAGLQAIRSKNYDLIISDVNLPDLSGEDVYTQLIAENDNQPPFIFITGYGSIDRAVRLLKLGAADYISKPFDLDLLVDKARLLCPMHMGNASDESRLENVLGISPTMREIEQSIPRLAKLASTILITGESGVGKEHVAQLIHRHARVNVEAPFSQLAAGLLPRPCLNRNCSATKRARSPARQKPAKAYSSKRMEEPCSSTRSARCRWACKSNCCA
jgi:DNA-binding NtrC family response regulator